MSHQTVDNMCEYDDTVYDVRDQYNMQLVSVIDWGVQYVMATSLED